MINHELPVVLTADDQKRVERKLAQLRERADGSDAAITRALQAARVRQALREDRQRRNDTYPGEWDCGV